MSLKSELIDLMPSLMDNDDNSKINNYYISSEVFFTDFNRQIIEPNTEDKYPSGALCVFADDDFYTVAILPYKFKEMELLEILNIIFPEIKDPLILPDHGDYWWTAQRDSSLEVPGEPWELWFVENQKKVIPQEIVTQIPHVNSLNIKSEVRLRTCKTEDEAIAATNRIG